MPEPTTAPVTAETVPAELIAILDRWAGREHSRRGPVVACLAEILTVDRLRRAASVPADDGQQVSVPADQHSDSDQGKRDVSAGQSADRKAVPADDLRERMEAVVENWFNHLPDDAEPTVEEIAKGIAGDVIAELVALCDPGDLPARMADAIWGRITSAVRPDPTVTPDGRVGSIIDVTKEDLAEVALSVRWEAACQSAAELAETRERLREATGNAQSYWERKVAAERQRDAEKARADKAEAEVERLADFGLGHRERAEAAEAQVAAIRQSVVDVYGEDYGGEDVAAEVRRLLAHLVEHEADVLRLRQSKNEALASAQDQVAALRQELAEETAQLEALRNIANRNAESATRRQREIERELAGMRIALREWATLLARGTGEVVAVDVAWKLRQIAGTESEDANV